MSPSRLSLEDFDAVPPAAEPVAAIEPVDTSAHEAAIEAARVQGYESGYKSGWDDASRAAEEERKAIGEELARNLREASFTYFEARDDLLVNLRGFVSDLLETLFPSLLSESVAAAVTDAITGFAEDASEGELALAVSPDDAEIVRTLLPLPGVGEVSLVAEPALVPGQARLRVASREFSIDADRILSMLRDSLIANPANNESVAHGRA